MIDYIIDKKKYNINYKKIATIFDKYIKIKGNIEITYVNIKEIKDINKKYAKNNNPTDVLSFNLSNNFLKIIGEVFVCPEYIIKIQKVSKSLLLDNIVLMIVHGTLHILGYDHYSINDKNKMFNLQEQIISEYKK